jgi:hypothetical protein
MGRGVSGRFFLWLSVAFVLGIVVSLVVANLGAAEKKIDRPLERVHDARDPAFARDLSLLLGPPLVDGNAAEVLVNGDRIFKAMLEDIRGATSSPMRSPTGRETASRCMCCSTGSAAPSSTSRRSTG